MIKKTVIGFISTVLLIGSTLAFIYFKKVPNEKIVKDVYYFNLSTGDTVIIPEVNISNEESFYSSVDTYILEKFKECGLELSNLDTCFKELSKTESCMYINVTVNDITVQASYYYDTNELDVSVIR